MASALGTNAYPYLAGYVAWYGRTIASFDPWAQNTNSARGGHSFTQYGKEWRQVTAKVVSLLAADVRHF